MKIVTAGYTSGRIAIDNLSASIDALEAQVSHAPAFDTLVSLSELLFLRGDLLGRIADHDRADVAARAAVELRPATAEALTVLARLAERFHRFGEAHALLDGAIAEAGPNGETVGIRAALWQATGRFMEAFEVRAHRARVSPGIDTLGALATLLAEMGRWSAAERLYAQALEADMGASPIPCAQLLFEWGVGAMRRGELRRADEILQQLAQVLPAHVPGRGHRAEVAFARGHLDLALELIEPVCSASDDPEYSGVHAEILSARGDHSLASAQARRAAGGYDSLLARRPEAYADHAAHFFLGIGNRPLQALELARKNHAMRDTQRTRRLLARAEAAVAARRLADRDSGCSVALARTFA